MNKLIIDFEATCTDKEEFPRHEMEIIEIGAVMCSPQGDILDEFCTFIKPVRNPKLTKFCTDLTSITQEQIDNSPLFADAMKKFEEWLSWQDDYLFCSWGDYDKKQLNRDCQFHNYNNPLKGKHLNIKKEFAKQQRVKPCGVKKALNLAGMQFKGSHHRGIDDAKNMARLMPWIQGNKYV